MLTLPVATKCRLPRLQTVQLGDLCDLSQHVSYYYVIVCALMITRASGLQVPVRVLSINYVYVSKVEEDANNNNIIVY